MVVTLGQQYNIEEKPTVILYSYINRHAGRCLLKSIELPEAFWCCARISGSQGQ